MRKESVLVWFRNDLRLHDQEALCEANRKFEHVIPIYIFDPRFFQAQSFGFPKMGAFRLKFLIESVRDLQRNLQHIGSDLLVRIGFPEHVLPELAKQLNVKHIHFSEEAAPEERTIEQQLQEALIHHGILFDSWWQSTLCAKKDLPFSIPQLPDVFTKFRVQVERNWNHTPPLPAPTHLPTLPANAQQAIAENQFPPYPEIQTDQRAAKKFVGGEQAAIDHLNQYIWQKEWIATYEETRNGMLGEDYSSKLSPWLALGCISPRFIFSEVKRFEATRLKNKSTYWLIFELLWRDYFRFATLKYGAQFFKLGGIKNIAPQLIENKLLEKSWCEGQTGFPFIDANMRELRHTGFMSNRGRQNVASFFVHVLQQDWRIGAAWFESQLIDYDPCSNWGNWCYIAGVGNDPRKDRFFNTAAQSERYDTHGEFMKYWCPELHEIPPRYLHRFFEYSETTIHQLGLTLGTDYPRPVCSFIATTH